MDSVRFGRVLGIGARHAVKTLVTAVDAATAPAPSTQSRTPPQPSAASSRPVNPARKVAHLKRNVGEGKRRFGQAAWSPFVRLSGVLWLEVTGTFFGLFAVLAASYAWKSHSDLHAAGQRGPLILGIVMTVVFGYFCVSNFVKAHRRGKRH